MAAFFIQKNKLPVASITVSCDCFTLLTIIIIIIIIITLSSCGQGTHALLSRGY